ncbi:glycosyltransferase family 2 protein [Komagataeibacter sp. FNDCR2]|uniref:glycosyltransferase n=1 Tax=Komagataeibacter sp. FNDCR2 TaxID=2878682 RepID=UPI001E51B777|nr:glycosyltransferase family A protein [Komagataeibacter sp. FNDCR2]MCE2574155.1 glycosyltransferase family 2 protein [Komagataeibacter sp. FNDCR2]
MLPARLRIHPLVVAIPVRNEAERINTCLSALASQREARLTHAVLLLNNCTDNTPCCVRDYAARLPFAVSVIARTYPPSIAHVGTARREAMEIAARIAGPDGILFTTDADGAPSPDWLVNTLAAFDRGADAVCGRAVIDPVEALLIPAHLHRDDEAESAYATLLDRIHDLIDPDPHDPWPRHTEHSGASIAVSVSGWERAGGIPALPLGEDRGFLAALRRVDAAIRHAPDVVVSVSGRVQGRASGGMADTMARRLVRQDEMLDDTLEPAADCLRRAQARARLRGLYGLPSGSVPRQAAIGQLADRLKLPPRHVADIARSPFFGMAWDRLEAAAGAVLRRRPVRRVDLEREFRQAERIVRRLLAARATSPHPALPSPGSLLPPLSMSSR